MSPKISIKSAFCELERISGIIGRAEYPSRFGLISVAMVSLRPLSGDKDEE